jgi:hypothetical protein
MLWPILSWLVFGNLQTVYFFNFTIFFLGGGGAHSKLRILKQRIRGHNCILFV